MRKIFSSFFEKRINRAKYLFVLVIILILESLYLFNPILLDSIRSGESNIAVHFILIFIVSSFLIIYFTIKRLHDINLTGVFSIILLFPIVNFFLLLKLLFQRGTPYKNKFGNITSEENNFTKTEENENDYKVYVRKLNVKFGIITASVFITYFLVLFIK
jgi:uncharacterized membrane protein YhaH (DUF805 family)